MSLCPDPTQLGKYVKSQLDSDEMRMVTLHLESCSQCQHEISQTNSGRMLFDDLKKVIQSDRDILHEHGIQDSKHFDQAILEHGYRIIGELSRGGQGIVYRAIQIATNRVVAIKQIKKMDSSLANTSRFEREVDVIARFSHQGIITIFDSGCVSGFPYFVMEYVNGKSLGEFFKAARDKNTVAPNNPKYIRSVLEVARKIFSAISYAHRLGVIHRDLKPSNILIDKNGEPKVLDFGLAKLFDERESQLTQTGQFLGTLAYASPEQLQLESQMVDIRSDIYSLGVILYELLTGQLPYAVDGALSNVVDNILHFGPEPPHKFCNSIDNDLETVLLKTLAKDADRRYQTVDQLNRDVGNYLAGLPLEAKRDSGWYVLKKTILRHKKSVSLAVAVFLVVVGALIASLYFWGEAVKEGNLAREATANEKLAREHSELQAYIANISASKGAIESADVAEAKRRLNNAPATLRNWEWWYWSNRSDDSAQTIDNHALFIYDFDYAVSARQFVSLSGENRLQVWHADHPNHTSGTSIEGPGAARNCAINDKGDLIACIVGDSRLLIFDFQSLEKLKEHVADVQLVDLSFLDDSTVVFAGNHPEGNKGSLQKWDIRKNQFTKTSIPHSVLQLATHKNSNKIAIAGSQVLVFDNELSVERKNSKMRDSVTLAFNRKGDKLAVASNYFVSIIDLKKNKTQTEFSSQNRIRKIVFDANDNSVVTIGYDRTISKWNLDSPLSKPHKLIGHDQMVTHIESKVFDGLLVSSSQDAKLKLWDLTMEENPKKIASHRGIVRAIDFAPDGKSFATAAMDGEVIIRETATTKRIAVLRHAKAVYAIRFSPDGKSLATGGEDRIVRIWNLATQKAAELPGHRLRIHSVDFDTSGKKVVSASMDKTVRVWDIQSKRELLKFDGHNDCVHAARFNSSGNLIASRCHKEIIVWDSSTGEEVYSVAQRMGAEDYSLQFHPHGELFAAGSSIEGFGKGFVNFFDTHSNSVRKCLLQHNTPITALDFSPDGSRVVSSSSDSIKIWDFERGVEIASMDGANDGVYCLRFSPSGRYLAAGTSSGTIVLWDSGRVFLPQNPSEYEDAGSSME